MQAAWLPFASRTQTGVETKVVFGGQTQVHAKIRFHESAAPMQVDYYNLVGKAKGSVSRGLFRWDGEEAVFCIAAPGAPRPSDFSSGAGSGRTSAVGSESGNRWYLARAGLHLAVPKLSGKFRIVADLLGLPQVAAVVRGG
jgi:uncharacterized protein (TIGR03067 family)